MLKYQFMNILKRTGRVQWTQEEDTVIANAVRYVLGYLLVDIRSVSGTKLPKICIFLARHRSLRRRSTVGRGGTIT